MKWCGLLKTDDKTSILISFVFEIPYQGYLNTLSPILILRGELKFI